MTAGEVADNRASFTGDQLACGEIPWFQGDLKVTVNAAGGYIGQIQRGRAGATAAGSLASRATRRDAGSAQATG